MFMCLCDAFVFVHVVFLLSSLGSNPSNRWNDASRDASNAMDPGRLLTSGFWAISGIRHDTAHAVFTEVAATV